MLEENLFIEQVLPSEVLRGLTEEEMAVYRRPYLEPGESRRPTLTWPRQVPVAGEPADVHDIVRAYGAWLAASDLPKLFVEAVPGRDVREPPRVRPVLAAAAAPDRHAPGTSCPRTRPTRSVRAIAVLGARRCPHG